MTLKHSKEVRRQRFFARIVRAQAFARKRAVKARRALLQAAREDKKAGLRASVGGYHAGL